MNICATKNGFIVAPQQVHAHEAIDFSNTYVFTNYKDMFDYIKQHFGPLVETSPKPYPQVIHNPVSEGNESC